MIPIPITVLVVVLAIVALVVGFSVWSARISRYHYNILNKKWGVLVQREEHLSRFIALVQEVQDLAFFGAPFRVVRGRSDFRDDSPSRPALVAVAIKERLYLKIGCIPRGGRSQGGH